MNASSNVSNVEIANKIASTATLFRKYFPDASVNFSPWENSNNESMTVSYTHLTLPTNREV